MRFVLTRTQQDHLALTQFYRWLQFYERPVTETRLELQLEILDPAAEIVTSNWQGKGLEAYEAAVRKFPRGERQTHHVTSTKTASLGTGATRLVADVLCRSITPQGDVTDRGLRYDVRLVPSRDQDPLPHIEHLHASQVEVLAGSPATTALIPPGHGFRDQYPAHRAKSSMHAWLALMEFLGGSVDPFTALLDFTFLLDLRVLGASRRMGSVPEFEQWLEALPSQLVESCHRVTRTDVNVLPDGRYALEADVDWTGRTPQGQRRSEAMRQRWVLRDVGERFARIVEGRFEPMPLSSDLDDPSQ